MPIYHDQTPSTSIDLTGLQVTEGVGDAVHVAGTAQIQGETVGINAVIEVPLSQALFLTAAGVPTISPDAGIIAHLAWREPDGLHAVRHVAPPPEPEPAP